MARSCSGLPFAVELEQKRSDQAEISQSKSNFVWWQLVITPGLLIDTANPDWSGLWHWFQGSHTSIQPLPATVIVFYHSHQLLFPGAKFWYFFITRTGKQGLVTGSGANFFFFVNIFLNLVQNKGLLLTISSWEPLKNPPLQHQWLPSSPHCNTSDSSCPCLAPAAGSAHLPHNSCILTVCSK